MNPRATSVLGLVAACAAAGLAAAQASAAEWRPTERVVLVTHAGPGSGIDLFLRTVQGIWEKEKIVDARVENMTGGRGERARRHVATQNKGNAHMMIGFTPQMIVGPIVTKSDVTVKSFTPVAIMVVEPMVLYVNAQQPWKSVKELVEAARAKPRAILQGGGGFGAPPSIAGRDLARESGVELSYTPFKSSAEAVVALLGGHVHLIMEQPSEAEQHVKAGKLRALASVYPSALHPDLPTFASLGYKFRVLKQFRGLMAPPGMPAEAVAHYTAALERARRSPQWRQYVERNELVEEWIAGKALADFVQSEEKVYADIQAEIAARKRKK